jgi:hypothetical protein
VRSKDSVEEETAECTVLTVVVKRFMSLKQATGRKDLILQFENSWVIGDLVNRNVFSVW